MIYDRPHKDGNCELPDNTTMGGAREKKETVGFNIYEIRQ